MPPMPSMPTWSEFVYRLESEFDAVIAGLARECRVPLWFYHPDMRVNWNACISWYGHPDGVWHSVVPATTCVGV